MRWYIVLAAMMAGLLTIPSHAADWPQLQNDPARTGYTPEQLKLPLVMAWTCDFKQHNSGRVQPVIAGGRVFVGTMDGQVHCLDAVTGKLLSSFQTDGPIENTVAVDGQTLYVPSQDGKLYALAIGSDGQLTRKWTFTTGAGIWTSPLVYKGNIYFGSRDRNFYAVSPQGDGIWRFFTGGPIQTSASTDGQRLYFASEDMNAYAVDFSGKQVWQARLNGCSVGDYWPVVSHGVVIYRTQPPYTGGPNRTGDVGKMKGDPSDPAAQAEYKKGILDVLAKDPFARTFYALDAASGKEKSTVPILYNGGCGNVPVPPPVDPDGRAYVYTFNPKVQQLGHTSGSYTILDLKTGQMGDIVPCPKYTEGKIEWIHDETNPFTLAGTTVMWAHMHGKFGWFDPTLQQAQNMTGDAYKLLPRHNTVTAHNCTGVSVSDGMAFWMFGGCLYAAKAQ